MYLSRDAERIGSPGLVARFRRRALVTGMLAGGLALAVLPSAAGGALWDAGRPAVGVSVVGGALGLVLLWRRRYRWARVAAACAAAGLLVGWALSLGPWSPAGSGPLPPVAPPAVAGPVLVVLLAGLATVAPCYVVMPRVLRARAE